MRILSESEMSEVFGGQSTGTAATTLGTVSVQGFRVTAGNYWQGAHDFGGGYSSYDEYSGGSMSTPHYYHPALSNPPLTPEEWRCKVAAAAAPGMGPDTGWTFAFINDYGYRNPSTKAVWLSETHVAAPTGYGDIRGLTVATVSGPNGSWVGGTTTLYASAFTAYPGNFKSAAYYNDAGILQAGRAYGPLGSIENAIMVGAHEARHQWQNEHPGQALGTNLEADAEAFANKALDRYRAGQTGPNC